MKRLAFLLLALLAAGAFAATVLADTTPPPTSTDTTTTAPTSATVPLGVTIAGVQIGGLSSDAATQAVTAAFNQPVTLRFGTTRIAVAPSLLGLSVSADTAVAKALTVAPNTQLTLRGTVDSSLVRAFVAKISARFARKPVSSKLVLRNMKPFVTPGVIGQTIEVNVGVRDLTNELVHGTRAPIVLQARYKQPQVTPSSIGPVIVIRRGDNKLTLYNGMKVVRSFSVATGQSIYPTPLGKFSIVVMWRNPWWYPPNSPWAAGEKPIPPGPGNPLGTRWMGLSSPGVGIHGTPEDGSIGYSLSHGCIRMHIPQAEWLFNHVKVGTPVYIVAA